MFNVQSHGAPLKCLIRVGRTKGRAKLSSKMAAAFPEVPADRCADFSSQNGSQSYDLSADADRYNSLPDSQSRAQESSDAGTASQDPDHGQCSRPNGCMRKVSSCPHDWNNAIIVHHERDSKRAFQFKHQLMEKLGCCVALYGDIQSAPLFGTLEKCCQRTKNIILLVTPAFEKDEKCQHIGQTIYGLQSSGHHVDIVPVYHGLQDEEKNPKRVVLCNAIPVTYENSEYFFATMKERLLKKEALCRECQPNDSESKTSDTRRKEYCGQRGSSSVKDSNGLRKLARATGRKETSARAPAESLPVDVTSDSSLQPHSGRRVLADPSTVCNTPPSAHSQQKMSEKLQEPLEYGNADGMGQPAVVQDGSTTEVSAATVVEGTSTAGFSVQKQELAENQRFNVLNQEPAENQRFNVQKQEPAENQRFNVQKQEFDENQGSNVQNQELAENHRFSVQKQELAENQRFNIQNKELAENQRFRVQKQELAENQRFRNNPGRGLQSAEPAVQHADQVGPTAGKGRTASLGTQTAGERRETGQRDEVDVNTSAAQKTDCGKNRLGENGASAQKRSSRKQEDKHGLDTVEDLAVRSANTDAESSKGARGLEPASASGLKQRVSGFASLSVRGLTGTVLKLSSEQTRTSGCKSLNGNAVSDTLPYQQSADKDTLTERKLDALTTTEPVNTEVSSKTSAHTTTSGQRQDTFLAPVPTGPTSAVSGGEDLDGRCGGRQEGTSAAPAATLGDTPSPETTSTPVVLPETEEKARSTPVVLQETEEEARSTPVVLQETEEEVRSTRVVLQETEEETRSAQVVLQETEEEVRSTPVVLQETEEEARSTPVVLQETEEKARSTLVVLQETEEEARSTRVVLQETEEEARSTQVVLQETEEEARSTPVVLQETEEEADSRACNVTAKEEETEVKSQLDLSIDAEDSARQREEAEAMEQTAPKGVSQTCTEPERSTFAITDGPRGQRHQPPKMTTDYDEIDSTTQEESIEENTFMDSDYDNKSLVDVNLSSKSADGMCQTSRPGHVTESRFEKMNPLRSDVVVAPSQSDSTNPPQLTSAGFDVQMNSLTDGNTHSVHGHSMASLHAPGDLKSAKEQSWEDNDTDRNDGLCSRPVQESGLDPPKYMPSSGPESFAQSFQSTTTFTSHPLQRDGERYSKDTGMQVTTQATMTSQPESPNKDCVPVIINIQRSDNLHIGLSGGGAELTQLPPLLSARYGAPATATVSGSAHRGPRNVGWPDEDTSQRSLPLDIYPDCEGTKGRRRKGCFRGLRVLLSCGSHRRPKKH